MQARAGLADLARHGAERNQAARIVGTVHMLADTHAPQNHRAFGLGKLACHLANCFSRHTANRCHGLRAVSLDVVTQRFVIASASHNEISVYQAFINHCVNQCIEQRHISVGLELQRLPGMPAHVSDARVSQHDFGAAFGSVFHPRGGDRVVGGGVGANDKNQIRMLHIIDLIAHCARAHPLKKRRYARRMAQASAVVYVIAAKTGTHQLLKKIGFFVAAFG